MATYATDFDEFVAGATSTNLTGFTVQDIGTWSSNLFDLGSGNICLRHTDGGSGNDLGLVTYDAFETTGAVEVLCRMIVGSTCDQNAPIGPALIAADGRCYAWRPNTAAPATAWRLALFSATGSVSESIGTAATWSEPAAGQPFWLMVGRDASGNIYGSAWVEGSETRPGTPMASANPTTDLTTVKPGFVTFDSSDDPIDCRFFGAATNGDQAPETIGGGGSTTATPTTGLIIMSGRQPSGNPFTNVRIRDVLISEAGSPVGSRTGIHLMVWYAGVPAGAPDLSYSSMTSDANGTISWSIATGSLIYNQNIFYVAHDGNASGSLSQYTCARVIPNYE